MIIPLPRGFRQKSDAFYAKTKVATEEEGDGGRMNARARGRGGEFDESVRYESGM